MLRIIYRKLKGYPSHWWRPVAQTSLESWEISPHQAKFNEVILSKRNELGILSNFACTPFVYHQKKYKSIEGFWQSLKFPENQSDERFLLFKSINFTREQVEQMFGRNAKHAGDEASKVMKENKIDWVSFEGAKINYYENRKGAFYSLIKNVMLEKYYQNFEVKEILEKTRSLKLLPDHLQDQNVPAAWKYFDIWMEIRDKKHPT